MLLLSTNSYYPSRNKSSLFKFTPISTSMWSCLIDWPSDRHASTCQLQWHYPGPHTARLHWLGVVWARGGGACPLGCRWGNKSGSQSGKCSLLFSGGEYYVPPPNPELYMLTHPFVPTNVTKLVQNRCLYLCSGWTGCKWQSIKVAIFPLRPR